MKLNNVPQPVLAKLIALEEVVEALSQRVAKTQDGIASARTRLTGSFARQSEYDDVTASLKQLVADKPVLEKKLHAAQSTLSSCKIWLDQLPERTVLEPVKVKADGDLEEVRARLKATEAELAALRAVPTPSANIEQRVKGDAMEPYGDPVKLTPTPLNNRRPARDMGATWQGNISYVNGLAYDGRTRNPPVRVASAFSRKLCGGLNANTVSGVIPRSVHDIDHD
jgi:hypothetical protein